MLSICNQNYEVFLHSGLSNCLNNLKDKTNLSRIIIISCIISPSGSPCSLEYIYIYIYIFFFFSLDTGKWLLLHLHKEESYLQEYLKYLHV